MRREAAEALGKIVNPISTEPLIAAFNGFDSWVRGKAVEVLGKIENLFLTKKRTAIWCN